MATAEFRVIASRPRPVWGRPGHLALPPGVHRPMFECVCALRLPASSL